MYVWALKRTCGVHTSKRFIVSRTMTEWPSVRFRDAGREGKRRRSGNWLSRQTCTMCSETWDQSDEHIAITFYFTSGSRVPARLLISRIPFPANERPFAPYFEPFPRQLLSLSHIGTSFNNGWMNGWLANLYPLEIRDNAENYESKFIKDSLVTHKFANDIAIAFQ